MNPTRFLVETPLVDAEFRSFVQQLFVTLQWVTGTDEFAVGHISETTGVFLFCCLVVQLTRISFRLRTVTFGSNEVELVVTGTPKNVWWKKVIRPVEQVPLIRA